MVQMALPSGQVLDFGDASDEQIQNILSTMKDSNPELFEESPPDLSSASYEELQAYYGGQETKESRRPKVEITHAGELESLGAQYDYAKADTDKGRADWITRRYGPGTFGQDENGRFYLKLDNIEPALKARDNLEDSGTMYINRPSGDL